MRAIPDPFDDDDFGAPSIVGPAAAGMTDAAPAVPAPALTPTVLPAAPTIEEQALARDAQTFVERARAFQITSPETFEEAGRIIETLKAKKRDVVAWFKPMADAAHGAWKAITTRRGGVTDPIDEAVTTLSARYAEYAKEAKRQAEAERKRLEREAHEREQAQLRAEADAAAATAATLEQQTLTASTREEAEELQQQAAELQQQSEQLRVEAATVQAPVVHVEPTVDPKRSGGPTVAQNWQHEVVDLDALVKAVAAGEVSRQAILANDTYLRQRAKADKGTAKIPGVRFFDAGSVVGRRRTR